jgi:CHAT domain-containing protein
LSLAAFAAALWLVCGSGTAQADPKDWPAFWRGRFDAQTVALLDNAYQHFRQEKPDKVLYEQAAVALDARLRAQQPSTSRTELLRRGRAWMFLGELLAGQDKREAGAAAEAQGLALIESGLPRPTAELAETLDSHATTWRLLDKPEKAMPLYQRCIAIFDQLRSANKKSLIDCLWRQSILQNNNDRPGDALALIDRAVPMAEKLYGAESSGVARMLRARGNALYDLNRNTEALTQYERALAIRDKLGMADDSYNADLAQNIGMIRSSLHQYEPALAALQRQLKIREANDGPDHPDTAAALADLGSVYGAMGRYADALPLYQRQLAIVEKTKGPEDQDVIKPLGSLATIYQVLGKYPAALDVAQRSLAVSEKVYGAVAPPTAATLLAAGLVYQQMGQSDRAVPLLQRCLAIREQTGGAEHRDTATPLDALGRGYAALGQYGEALSYMERGLAIHEKVDGPEDLATATALNNLASLNSLMGRSAAALPLAQRSLGIFEKVAGPEHVLTAQALNNIASIHGNMGHFDLAQPPLMRSAQIYVNVLGLENPMTALVMSNAGALLYLLGDQRASQILERVVAICDKVNGPEHPTTAFALTFLAASYYRLHQYDKVLGPLLRAERIAARTGSSQLAWMAQQFLSVRYAADQHRDLAIFWGKQAINTIQSLRAGIAGLDRDTQQSFLLDKRFAYSGLADLLIAAGRIPEAQAVMQMLKEEEYFDFIRRDATAGDVRSTRLPLTGLERRANEAYFKVRDRLGALGAEKDAILHRQETGAASPADLQRLTAIDEDLALASTAFDDFVAGLDRLLTSEQTTAGKAAQVKDQIKGAVNLVADLQAAGQRAAVVQYVVSEQRLHIILTTGSVQIPREIVITPKELNESIEAFRVAVQNPVLDPRPLGRKLYATLIEPVRADLEAQHISTLMLVLDGALRYVPFAALVRNDRYLIEDYRLAVYAEASKSRLARAPAKRWQVVALGTTHASEGFEALPAVRAELESIVRPDVLPGVVHLDEAFTRASLDGALHSPVLHIASHFSFVPGSDQSFLLLGDGEHLTLGDVRKGPRFDVDLLTLSACNTATGGGMRENGSEVEGLGMLAQEKGARAVLASLWSVADSSTGLLMQQFYRVRQQTGVNKAEALRAAQLALLRGSIKTDTSSATGRGATREPAAGSAAAPSFTANPSVPYAHPYFWAPFILMGNWL